ncbi:fatty acid desaturase CarF family protein [Citromicrobium bathyomarinum]|uniref:fatty acid desaturase CarF family protein n=1 Tax=Citromicrobium bathyomarinum TaxID=72174 RepID=UPI00315B3BF7
MTALSIIAQLLLGWLLADFLSGLVHWAEDRFGRGREHWPLIGPLVFAPNLLHHERPLDFTRASFVGRNWTTWIVANAIALLLLLAFGPQWWLLSGWIGGMMANEVHAWSHKPEMTPEWAKPLQRLGLIGFRWHHGLHHWAPHDRRYCILTTWLNPVLDRVRFWRGLERLLPKGWLR